MMTLFARLVVLGVLALGLAAPAWAQGVKTPLEEIIPCSDGDWECSREDRRHVGALPSSHLQNELIPAVARFLVYGMAAVAFVMFSVAGVMLVLAGACW